MANPTVRVELGPRFIGWRIDRALVEALQGSYSRSQLSRAFAAGGVRIDGRAVKPGAKVERSLALEVELPSAALAHLQPQDIPLHIVFEDDHLLVVDKPAGMVVHPSAGHPDGTLVNAVLHHLGVAPHALPVLPGNDETRPGIVHRLDKDTSGLLVLAKTAAAQARLAEQFHAHAIERVYQAVVAGHPEWTTKRVETTHGRDPTDRRRFSDTHGQRKAITTFIVERALAGACVVRCELETGRTHQIRVHARHLGHPVLGDRLYGRVPADPRVRQALRSFHRNALHARVLGFEHPATATRVRFEAVVPPEMTRLIAALS